MNPVRLFLRGIKRKVESCQTNHNHITKSVSGGFFSGRGASRYKYQERQSGICNLVNRWHYLGGKRRRGD